MNDTVGKLVRKFRMEKNYTQLAFAQLIGVGERHYRKLESGERQFSFEHLMKISDCFKVDIKEFYPPIFQHNMC